MSTRGKSRSRPARRDFLKSDASNTRRKARQQQARQQRPGKAGQYARTASCPPVRQQRAAPGKSASNYDKQSYDGNEASEEES